jgi:saccharopine dehydrogenase (NAD+, L-lysine forming)
VSRPVCAPPRVLAAIDLRRDPADHRHAQTEQRRAEMEADDMILGIRREDKNAWERRAPLMPEHVGRLIADHGVGVRVQPSTIRAFPDEAYAAVGATVAEDLTPCDVILAIKEIPVDALLAGKTYLFFSHTIKGQARNMPMLARLMELGTTLIDYEPITDDAGHRLIFFGRFAGIAGMIDTLWALGRRLESEGLSSPFAEIRPAHRYADLDEARAAVAEAGRKIARDGLPNTLHPLVVGVSG